MCSVTRSDLGEGTSVPGPWPWPSTQGTQEEEARRQLAELLQRLPRAPPPPKAGALSVLRVNPTGD